MRYVKNLVDKLQRLKIPIFRNYDFVRIWKLWQSKVIVSYLFEVNEPYFILSENVLALSI